MNVLGTGLSLVALGVSAFLAVYVLGLNSRALPNRAFFALMMTFVWWDACEAIERAIPTGAPASAIYPWTQGVWLGISAVPAALMQLALVYPEPRSWFRRLHTPLVYAPLFAWAYLIFGTQALISGVAEGPLGPSAQTGSSYLLLALLYAAWFYVSVALFVSNWWRVRAGSLRQVQGLVVLGLLIGSVPAGVTEIFWPLLDGYATRLGLGSVYTLVWSIFLAIAVVRYRYLVIAPGTEPSAALRARHPLAPGQNYLVLEPARGAGMAAFREIVSTTPGLCVTGLAPGRVAERFTLERTPILWITGVSSDERAVAPQALDFELVHTILKVFREHPGTAILLDDLDYLAAVNGFEAAARFLNRVANQASASHGTLIVTLDRGALAPEQLALLGGSLDHVLDFPELTDGLPSPLRNNAVLFVAPQEVPSSLPLLNVREGLVVTTEHPAKARPRYGDQFRVLWVTPHPEAGLTTARPTALDTEARRAVSGYLAAHPGGTVVLAGLEQLALFVDLRSLLSFVKDAADLAALHGGRVVATIVPGGMPAPEVAMVSRRLDVPSPPVVRSSLPGALTTAVPGSRTPIRGPVS